MTFASKAVQRVKQSEQFKIAERRERVADLYRLATPVKDIASELGIERTTVWRDLKAIHQRWIESVTEAYQHVALQQLQKLAWVESEATDAWLRSIGKTIIKRQSVEDGADGKKQKAASEERELAGDPRFLAEIRACVQERCKLFGLYAPERFTVTDDSLSTDTARNRVAALVERLGIEYVPGELPAGEAEQDPGPDIEPQEPTGDPEGNGRSDAADNDAVA